MPDLEWLTVPLLLPNSGPHRAADFAACRGLKVCRLSKMWLTWLFVPFAGSRALDSYVEPFEE